MSLGLTGVLSRLIQCVFRLLGGSSPSRKVTRAVQNLATEGCGAGWGRSLPRRLSGHRHKVSGAHGAVSPPAAEAHFGRQPAVEEAGRKAAGASGPPRKPPRGLRAPTLGRTRGRLDSRAVSSESRIGTQTYVLSPRRVWDQKFLPAVYILNKNLIMLK